MRYFFIIVGVLFLTIAVFAYQLGLDNNKEWGSGRTILLVVGMAFLLAGVAIHFWGDTLGKPLKRGISAINSAENRPNRITAAFILAVALTISVYLWVFDLDVKKDRRNERQEYAYYSELAKSFKDGRLYLAELPSPALLALDNPYDYFLRKELGVEDFPWDVSLYKEKFYLYWGAVPAVLITIFSKEQLSNIADFHLVFAFACGTFIYMALLITTFWRKSLHHSPAWLLGVLLIVVGLSTPVTIMLKDGRIYEVAIFGSQFLFIGGCYWAYSALWENKPEIWKLVLASMHWSSAVGTRFVILPVVIFCIGFTLIYLLIAREKFHRNLVIPISLLFPFALIGGILAWYNWARFDSVLEFGQTYQLTNVDYSVFQNVFSIQRIPQNIKLYIAHPLMVTTKFPYLSRIEHLHSSERMGGLAYITPYIFLLIIPVYYIVNRLSRLGDLLKSNTKEVLSDSWLLLALTGSGIISFTILMSFYFVTMRYMEDFMPALLIIITTQTGRAYEDLSQNKVLQNLLVITTMTLVSISLTANILLGIPNNSVRFVFHLVNNIVLFLGLK